MRKFLSVLFLITLCSCNKLTETENEINSVQAVLNYYDGECLKSKGFEKSNGTDKQFYEIEISNSKLLNQSADKLNSNAANIAYLFYSNLKNEKSNYQEIRVKINLSNGESQSFKYSDQEINEIEKLQPRINEIIEYIKTNNYEKLAGQFQDSIKVDERAISDLFTSLQSKYGKIEQTQFQGFQFEDSNNFGKLIIIREALVFEKIAASMNLIFNRESKNLISVEIP
ncbi:hypothetical protein ACFSX9_02270 [Flavobacterium ardleyense]|uniref:Lipoprotein n=1 Tax=Flavobacterium ardleyense TaxID=2038737 RepID=A0ABW5Z5X7_9FLAO